jgi:hypothetical protein
MQPSPSGRKRSWLTAAALLVPVLGLTPVLVSRTRSDAASLAAPVASTATTAPVDVTTTTAAEAVETTTTTTAPVATATTTTTAPAATTTPTTATATRSAASVTPTQLQQVEAIADSGGFDWRAAGVTIHIGYNPDACCHWGIYDYRDNSLWIGPTAFAGQSRLRYVVLHELGHAWQWATGRRGQLAADMAPWGYSGNDALEYGADCVATVWGARTNHYWTCPAAAQALVSRRLAGDWS